MARLWGGFCVDAREGLQSSACSPDERALLGLSCSGFGLRTSLAPWNELGNAPSSSIFFFS